MPDYIAKEKSFIDNRLYEAGETVKNYDGLPADNLIPIDDAGRAKAEEYEKSNKDRLAGVKDSEAAQKAEKFENPEAFAAAFAKEAARILADERAARDQEYAQREADLAEREAKLADAEAGSKLAKADTSKTSKASN